MTNPPLCWIESTSWELSLFGLPARIPWPSEVAAEVANQEPFELEHLLRAIALLGPDPGDPWATFQLAASVLDELGEALEESDAVRAKELLEEFERLHSGTAFARYHEAMAARMEGREDDALRLYREAAERTPKIAPIWDNIGVMLALRNDRDGAIDAFRRALELAPGDRTALEGLAQLRALVKLLRDPKDPQSAVFVDLPTFRKMVSDQLAACADDADQLLGRGEQLLREGMVPDIGLQAIERALQLRPDHPRTLLAMAAAWRMAGKFDQARDTAARYTQLYPEDPQGFFHLAQVLNAAGDSEGERAALDRLLALDPNVQPALGIRFQLSPTEHDPAKEKALTQFAKERNSWMAYVLASELARRRGDTAQAIASIERAYAISPDAEEVILHYTATIGDARDLPTLTRLIRPKVESGKYSRRLDWNYAQVLHQLGLRSDAIAVLRNATAAQDTPADFRKNATVLIGAWSGLLAGCGVPLEVHRSGFLVRPVLLALEDGDGGVVLKAGAPLPAEDSFPWRADGAEARVPLQQGQTGSAREPCLLGTFLIREIRAADGPVSVECQLSAQADGALHFRALQDGRKLPVGWVPPAAKA